MDFLSTEFSTLFPNLLVLGSVAGAVLVAWGRPLPGHLIWIPVNLGLMVHNYLIGQNGQAFLFGAFFVLACRGVRTWSRPSPSPRRTGNPQSGHSSRSGITPTGRGGAPLRLPRPVPQGVGDAEDKSSSQGDGLLHGPSGPRPGR